MKKQLLVTLATGILAITSSSALAVTGAELFKQHCTECHLDGGNSVNPVRTLHKKDRDQYGIKTWEDIVKNMRNPGPGMTAFDTATISDKDAKAIAEYVLETFK